MKLAPLGDRVVLKPLVAEETTKSGIVLPGTEKEKPQQAEIPFALENPLGTNSATPKTCSSTSKSSPRLLYISSGSTFLA